MLTTLASFLGFKSSSSTNDEGPAMSPVQDRLPTPMRQPTERETEEAKKASGLFYHPPASARDSYSAREDPYGSIRSRKSDREKRKRADSVLGRREHEGFSSVEHFHPVPATPTSASFVNKADSVRRRELRHTDFRSTNRSEPRLQATLDARQENKPEISRLEPRDVHGRSSPVVKDAKPPESQQVRSDAAPTPTAKDDEPVLRKIKSTDEKQPVSKDVIVTRGRSATINVRVPEPAHGGIVARGNSVGRDRAGSFVRRVGTPVESVQQASGDNNSERFKRKRDPSITRDGQIVELRARNDSLTKQLAAAQDEVVKSKGRNIELQKSIHTLQDEKSRALTSTNDALAKERDAQAKVAQLEDKLRKQEEETGRLKDLLKVAEERQLQTSKLLEVRSADLKGAQTFLTTADQYSGSDIIGMVESLNAEIFQTAAFMAELMENASIDAIVIQRQNLGKRGDALQYSRQYIGEGLFGHLTNKPLEVQTDPLPLQLAFQTILSIWCSSKARAFCSGPIGDELYKLYAKIRENELQAVAGRWRAIASSQIPAGQHSHADHILDCIISLLHYCGWQTRAAHNRKTILSMQQMLQGIEKQCNSLKTATKEGITTADMEVFIEQPGGAFNEETMEDIYAEPGPGRSRPGKSILCAVGMGLRRSTMKKSEGGVLENQTDVLTRMKVVLDSVIFDHGSTSIVPPHAQDGK
ncbi:hypothetical protein NLJ89_g2172 [Agrocybe chaxingu]|uniref:Uncharacterized protein n=1 Tax=Agrocybe chaxingu TaxID=84603 RepID=A0A9W8K4W1_9AGAR|nr:hypothetical protein NLJ89_g2172 [Agrocybe chaxingu]